MLEKLGKRQYCIKKVRVFIRSFYATYKRETNVLDTT